MKFHVCETQGIPIWGHELSNPIDYLPWALYAMGQGVNPHRSISFAKELVDYSDHLPRSWESLAILLERFRKTVEEAK